jgi:hypothetical protein
MKEGRVKSSFRAAIAVVAVLVAALGLGVALGAASDGGPTVRQLGYPNAFFDTKITDGPKKNTDSDKAKFKFKALSSSGFEYDGKFKCKLDSKGYKKCKSPKKYRHLDKGEHTFKVKGKVGTTADDSPDTYHWKVKEN